MSNDELLIKIRAITEGIDAANNQLAGLSGQLGAVRGSSLGAAEGHAAHGEKLTTLHEILGSSRRETMLLERSLVDLTGASRTAAMGFEALMTGMSGPMLLLVLGAEALMAFKQKIDEGDKSLAEQKQALAESGLGLDEYIKKLKEAEEANNPSNRAASWLQGTSDAGAKGLQQTSDDLALTLNNLASGQHKVSQASLEAEAAMRRQSAAAVEMGQYIHDDAQAHLEAAAKASIHSGELLKLAEAEATVHGVMEKGVTVIKAWKTLTDEQKLSMYDLAKADSAAAAATADLNANMAESAKLMDQVEAAQATQAKSMDDLIDKHGKAISDAYAAAADSAEKSLEKMAAGELKVSTVDHQDVRRQQLQKEIAGGGLSGDKLKSAQAELYSLGDYVEKYDENIRRLRAIDIAGNFTQGDLPSLLAKMPSDIQAALKAAFDSGGSAKLRLTAKDLIAQGENFSNPEMWDVKKMADDLKKKVTEEGNKIKMSDMIVKESGLDPNDPLVQKALGQQTGADRAMKINAQFSFDEAKIREVADAAVKKAEDRMREINVAKVFADRVAEQTPQIIDAGAAVGTSILSGFGAIINAFAPGSELAKNIKGHQDSIEKAGTLMGDYVVKGLSAQITDAAESVAGSFMRALTNSLDNRYVTQKKIFGVGN